MAHHILPDHPSSATLIARVWDPVSGGPRVCVVRGDELVDITPAVGTVSNLCDHLENLEAHTSG
jgi:fumarylacetoacetate (FAA) hydrolase family protein